MIFDLETGVVIAMPDRVVDKTYYGWKQDCESILILCGVMMGDIRVNSRCLGEVMCRVYRISHGVSNLNSFFG